MQVSDYSTPNIPDLGDSIAGEKGFQDKTVFITGATGFIGKVLIEKLLRSCPLVNKIYVLVRSKRNKDPHLRMKEIFNVPLFDRLKTERGENIFKKIVTIPGDIVEIGLGISEENRELLRNEVQIILHVAATIRFDEPLTKAVLMNTRGTKFMLDLAKECKHLLAFNHISTAYCYPHEKVLYEKAYPPPADPEAIIESVEWLGKEFDDAKDTILGNYPNTYAFTKALAEDLVYQEFETLPGIIFRPSVVIPSWKEPMPGWIDNINGPAGLFIAGGKGVLRSMYGDPNMYADFVPVDVLVNLIIITTFDFLNYRERRIFNCTSSLEIQATWGEIVNLGTSITTSKIPFNGVAWYPGGNLHKSWLWHSIIVIFCHYLPAIILDTIIILSGNKPALWKVQQRISKGFDIFQYYTNNQWEFDNANIVTARTLLTENEKKIYKADSEGIILADYFFDCIHGLRLYVMNESDSTIPRAKRHMKIMWAIDRIARYLFRLGLVYFLYINIIKPIFGI